MASLMIALGLHTPPVGLATFAAASAGNYPVARVFRSASLFALVAGVVLTVLLISYPALITWLPQQIR